MWSIYVILIISIVGIQANVFASDQKHILGEIDASKALKLLYGNLLNQNDKSNMHAVWYGYLNEAQHKYSQYYKNDDNKDGDVFIAFEGKYKEDGISKYILITQTRPHDDETHGCHACGVLVGAAIFRKSNNEWILEAENKFIGVMGKWGWINRDVFGFGIMDKLELVKIGQNKYGVIMQGDDINQGYENYYVYLIGYNGTELGILLSDGFEGPSRGACLDVAAENKQSLCINIVETKDSDNYDIYINIKKNVGKCGQVKSVAEKHRYVSDTGKYIKK